MIFKENINIRKNFDEEGDELVFHRITAHIFK